MITEEQPIFPTFACYSGNSLKSFTKIETTLYSDIIYLRGISINFENTLPLSKIKNVTYNDWREELGLLLLKVALPYITVVSIYIYFIFQEIIPGILTLILVAFVIHFLRTGELNIIIRDRCLSLVGNKNTLRHFWDHLESSLSNLDSSKCEIVDKESLTINLQKTNQ